MITAGKDLNPVIWSNEIPAELTYAVGHNPLHGRFFGGVE